MRISFSIFLIAALLSCTSRNEKKLDRTSTDIIKLRQNDVALEKPQPGDWLFEHTEKGQNYETYIAYDPVRPSATRNKIYLLPIGKFDEAQKKVIQYTADYLKIFFGLSVSLLPGADDTAIPSHARRMREDNHEQFKSTYILTYLKNHIPKDGIVVMAITATDLYPADDWNFVFGSSCYESACRRIFDISLFRRSAHNTKLPAMSRALNQDIIP
ncbi:zinc metalloprotease [Pseudochryseolinea flava]|uniref:hypothetical protein n=1 Tax=Pseudochryseolinea flava TaxID=2059302 RepID=UPI001FE77375|nr:hypothetical protein [Pseudochryseolinea flava]